jgi:hypothetical protein
MKNVPSTQWIKDFVLNNSYTVGFQQVPRGFIRQKEKRLRPIPGPLGTYGSY